MDCDLQLSGQIELLDEADNVILRKSNTLTYEGVDLISNLLATGTEAPSHMYLWVCDPERWAIATPDELVINQFSNSNTTYAMWTDTTSYDPFGSNLVIMPIIARRAVNRVVSFYAVIPDGTGIKTNWIVTGATAPQNFYILGLGLIFERTPFVVGSTAGRVMACSDMRGLDYTRNPLRAFGLKWSITFN